MGPGRYWRLALRVLAGAVGVGLFGLLLWNVGITGVIDHLRQIGWLTPLILVPYAGIALLDAKGWACTIPKTSLATADRLSLVRLALQRLAGEAVNQLLPTAQVGGEATKVYLLRTYGIAPEAGTASVVAAKTALTAAQIVFILLGLPLFLSHLGWGAAAWWTAALLAVAAYGFVTLLIRWQRRGLAVRSLRLLRAWLPRWQKLGDWQAGAARTDEHLVQLYEGTTGSFATSTVYFFLGWLLGAGEVWFFFKLIGIQAGFGDALIIETMIQPVTAAALVIPGALGVQEAGGVFLCRLLGIDESAGLTLMVLRRARETTYSLVGLATLARAGHHRSLPANEAVATTRE